MLFMMRFFSLSVYTVQKGILEGLGSQCWLPNRQIHHRESYLVPAKLRTNFPANTCLCCRSSKSIQGLNSLGNVVDIFCCPSSIHYPWSLPNNAWTFIHSFHSGIHFSPKPPVCFGKMTSTPSPGVCLHCFWQISTFHLLGHSHQYKGKSLKWR